MTTKHNNDCLNTEREKMPLRNPQGSRRNVNRPKGKKVLVATLPARGRVISRTAVVLQTRELSKNNLDENESPRLMWN